MARQNFESISLEAPDDTISGLLGVRAAGRICLEAEAVYPLPGNAGGWHLLAVRSGTVWMAREDGSCALEVMQAQAVPGGEALSLMAREDCELTWFRLSGQAADRLLRETAARGGLFFPVGGDPVHAAFQELSARQGTVPAALASGTAYQMLARLYGTGRDRERVPTHIPKVVGDAVALMQKEFAFLDGIADLAERLALSQEYLTRTFRSHMGVTPGRYLTRLRVEHAKLLLRQGNPVAFVSDACGFSNGNYFAKVFRQVTGRNPSEYARSAGDITPGPDGLPGSFYVL